MEEDIVINWMVQRLIAEHPREAGELSHAFLRDVAAVRVREIRRRQRAAAMHAEQQGWFHLWLRQNQIDPASLSPARESALQAHYQGF